MNNGNSLTLLVMPHHAGRITEMHFASIVINHSVAFISLKSLLRKEINTYNKTSSIITSYCVWNG